MNVHNLEYFALLKREIVQILKQSYNSVPEEIESWKGQDIVYFQEDLMYKVKGSISEKWFYTHIKLSGNKLPRIDMLNLLSRYAGYIDWNDFVEKNSKKIPPAIPIGIKGKSIKNRFLLALLGLIIIMVVYFSLRPNQYVFCFIDAASRNLLSDQNIEIIILNEEESPTYKQCFNGCVSIEHPGPKIRFVVKSPYYKTDTIVRTLNSDFREEQIQLHSNDYALMIHYFSKSKLTDWQKRRKQLDYMFADNAQIYQLYDDRSIGMELYNKSEFINKLTMPLRSLQNIEIVETIFEGNQIAVLKFRQTQSQ